MASRFEVDDGLWAEIAPLIPRKERRRRYPGRLPRDDRQALNGILFVLKHRDRLARPALRSSATARG